MADGQLHAVLLSQLHQRLDGVVALGQLGVGLALHVAFAELPVVAVGGEHRGLIVAQMAQTVGGQLVTAHGTDQAGHLAGAPAHQCALQRHKAQTVQKTGGDTHHVLGGGAYLVAQQVAAVVEADQVAGEFPHQPLLHVGVLAVDDHAVGHAAIELLHVTRPQPYGDGVGAVQILTGHLTEPFSGADLQTFHAQHKGLVPQCHGPQLLHQAPQALGADGDDDDLRVLYAGEVGGQRHGFRQRQ